MSPNANNANNSLYNGVRSLIFQRILTRSPTGWLENKRLIDNAEGLWRVHDGLYDVSEFIKQHPGGPFWLESTKGTDITEAFENHHIASVRPENILKQYYVREAKLPRRSPFTFHEDGFYRTLKRNVRKMLKTIPKEEKNYSDMYTDSFLVAMFLFAISASFLWSYILATISGIFSGLTILAAHNYYHQKDNFRMYYSDLCILRSRDFRIVHILSHHVYPNTGSDAQVFFAEPFVIHLPEKKSFITKYGSWIYGPFLFWPFAFQGAVLLNILNWMLNGKAQKIDIYNFLPLVLPLTMLALGGQSFFATIVLWQFIISVASFTFSIVALTNCHFHPDIYIEGDTPRSDMDWGINQLDTIADRYDISGNKFLVLVSFGDHALHHLFPTLDHSLLHYLYPVAKETMKQFNVDIRMVTQADMFTGYFRQVAREKRNPNPPNLLGKSSN